MGTRSVRFYFDFVSPYAWMAFMQARDLASRLQIRWQFHPVVYAKLLQANGLSGPVETTAKRRYTFWDVARCAAQQGLILKGPPAHPFRSLEALRTVCLFLKEPQALDLCVALADTAWGKGEDLADLMVIEQVVASVGLPHAALEERLKQPAVKGTLRRLTQEAVELGVFGVPTFSLDDELFWGQDRLPYLERRLQGAPRPTPEQMKRILARPAGVVRKERK